MAKKRRPQHTFFESSSSGEESDDGENTYEDEGEEDTGESFLLQPTPRPKVYTMSAEDTDVSESEKEEEKKEEDDEKEEQAQEFHDVQSETAAEKQQDGATVTVPDEVDEIESVSSDESHSIEEVAFTLPEGNDITRSHPKVDQEDRNSCGRKVSMGKCKTPRSKWVVECGHCKEWGSEDKRGLPGHLAHCPVYQKNKRNEEAAEKQARVGRYAEGTPEHAVTKKEKGKGARDASVGKEQAKPRAEQKDISNNEKIQMLATPARAKTESEVKATSPDKERRATTEAKQFGFNLSKEAREVFGALVKQDEGSFKKERAKFLQNWGHDVFVGLVIDGVKAGHLDREQGWKMLTKPSYTFSPGGHCKLGDKGMGLLTTPQVINEAQRQLDFSFIDVENKTLVKQDQKGDEEQALKQDKRKVTDITMTPGKSKEETISKPAAMIWIFTRVGGDNAIKSVFLLDRTAGKWTAAGSTAKMKEGGEGLETHQEVLSRVLNGQLGFKVDDFEIYVGTEWPEEKFPGRRMIDFHAYVP